MSSRPTTPQRRRLQRSSGIHLLLTSPKVHYPVDAEHLPLEAPANTERFGRLSDGLEELDVNMTNLQQIHDALLLGFNESFASFMYGLLMTMWCVDFPGCPTRRSWERLQEERELEERIRRVEERLRRAKEENERLKDVASESVTTTGTTTTPVSRPRQEPSREARQESSREARQESSRETRPYKPSRTTFTPRTVPRPVASTRPMRTFTPKTTPKTTPTPRFTAKPATKLAIPESRIPQPTRRGTGPNLNQPPRYMRGLFEGGKRQKRAE